MDMMSDTYLESVQVNEKPAYKTLTEVIAIVRGKKANNMTMMTAQEELVEDYLQEWAQLFGSENAK